jgi:CBS domain-containing protein
MRLHEIMTRDVQTISASASISEARAVMRSKRVHHLLVRDGRQVVGVVSQRDFGVRPGTAERQRVADVMSLDLVTGKPDTTVQQAASLFRGRSIGCLPVLDGSKPVGIVTTTDLLALLARRRPRG